MRPQLHINIFGKRISSFIFLGILGYLLGVLLGIVLAIQLQMSIRVVWIMSLISVAMFFLLAYAVKVIFGKENIVYYHHKIAITISCALVLFLLKQPILPYLDIMIMGIGTFLIFGRFGCLSVGCCHGTPCKYGIKYGEEHVKKGFTWYYKNVKLFPVQLVEACVAAAIVTSGVGLLINTVKPGTVLLYYLAAYSLFRFFIEFFRGDSVRPIWNGVSEAQWTSVALAFVLAIMSYYQWLPIYLWFTITSVILLVSLITTIIIYHIKSTNRLIDHKHIPEIVEGVLFLSRLPQDIQKNNDQENISIYKTSQGMNLSKGMHGNGCFYTISYKKNLKIGVVTRIARILKVLNKGYATFSVEKSRNRVYHILFWNEESLTKKV